MANATSSLIAYPLGSGGRSIHLTTGAAVYAGTMVAQLTADGTVVPATTALSGPVIGVAAHDADSGSEVEILTDREFLFANGTGGNACSSATLVGWNVYCGDDHTIYDNSAGGTLPYAGVFMGMDASGKVRVLIEPGFIAAQTAATTITLDDAHNHFDTDNVEAALNQIVDDLAATTATHGANMIGFQDSGNKTASTTVDAVLDEILVDATSTLGVIELPLASFADADGDIVKFANAGADGLTLVDSKSFALRFNNAANPPHMIGGFGVPYDADITANFNLKFLVSKTGATAGDATKITVEAFNQVDGALHDADADYGGDTDAVVPEAAAKTLDVLTLVLAAGNLPVAGSRVSLSIHPKDGTLGTDDFLIHRIWVEYTRKLRTA